jgi:hypothetical protein
MLVEAAFVFQSPQSGSIRSALVRTSSETFCE